MTTNKLHASVNQADGGNLELQLSGSPKLVIDTSGNVGIGTTSPASLLQVGTIDTTTGDNTMVITGRSTGSSEGGELQLHMAADYDSTYNYYVIDVVGDYLRIRRAGIGSDIVLNSSGNVGIGTTTPNFKLDVRGSIGNNGTMHHTSDRRLKKDIKPLTNSLEKVLALQGVQYRWKKPLDRPMEGIQIGVIAQDVQAVVPEVVLTAQNVSQTLSVNYDALTPLLIEAIKELKADNDNLREELNSLKAARQ